MIELTLTLQGPLFDGRADKALDDYTRAVAKRVADKGTAEVRTRLAAVLRHPTAEGGHYRDHITNRAVTDGYLITDTRSEYGPWLEGTSTRNRTTRFKGYHTFRLITQQLGHQAQAVAESAIGPYIVRMGGR